SSFTGRTYLQEEAVYLYIAAKFPYLVTNYGCDENMLIHQLVGSIYGDRRKFARNLHISGDSYLPPVAKGNICQMIWEIKQMILKTLSKEEWDEFFDTDREPISIFDPKFQTEIIRREN